MTDRRHGLAADRNEGCPPKPHGLAAAAASASDAGWRVVDGGRDDAASHAAAKQLANAAAFLDVERAVERVFGSSSSAAAEEGGSGWFVF